MTSRGLSEADFDAVAGFLDEVLQVRRQLAAEGRLGLTFSCFTQLCVCRRPACTPGCRAVSSRRAHSCMRSSAVRPCVPACALRCAALCRASLADSSRACCCNIAPLSPSLPPSFPQVAKEVQESHGKLLKDWAKGLEGHAKIADIRARVEAFAAAFPMPGFDVAGLA